MKVIFLDIDGVLNTLQTFIDIRNEWKSTGKRRIEIDEFRLNYLKQIIDESGAKIVLSSSWRAFFKKQNKIIPLDSKANELIQLLDKYNIQIYDLTPFDKNRVRQNEIIEWLTHNKVESFVILDDDSYDLPEFIDKELIKTSFTTNGEMIKDMKECCGLCECHILPALNILNSKTKILK